MIRGWLFICPHESEIQIWVILTTRRGKQESARRFDREISLCLTAVWERKFGDSIFFFLIQVRKFLIQFSYRNDWTITVV